MSPSSSRDSCSRTAFVWSAPLQLTGTDVSFLRIMVTEFSPYLLRLILPILRTRYLVKKHRPLPSLYLSYSSYNIQWSCATFVRCRNNAIVFWRWRLWYYEIQTRQEWRLWYVLTESAFDWNLELGVRRLFLCWCVLQSPWKCFHN
jgi:hypothetical protein